MLCFLHTKSAGNIAFFLSLCLCVWPLFSLQKWKPQGCWVDTFIMKLGDTASQHLSVWSSHSSHRTKKFFFSPWPVPEHTTYRKCDMKFLREPKSLHSSDWNTYIVFSYLFTILNVLFLLYCCKFANSNKFLFIEDGHIIPFSKIHL